MKLLQVAQLCTLLRIFPLIASLDILLSSTDSWVDKNARYLYPALVERGHRVVYVGPLHSEVADLEHRFTSQETSPKSNPNIGDELGMPKASGDFGHLTDEHQSYFRYLRKLHRLARGPRHVISKQASASFDAEFDQNTRKLVRNRAYGQDPLNPDFWYVDGSPVEALSVALEAIVPGHVTGFFPDVVLIGPNEGLHLTPNAEEGPQISMVDLLEGDHVEAMRLLAQVKNIPAISVSTEDVHNIYYEDEDFFNVEAPSYEQMFKQNAVSQNVQFVNSRVLDLVEKVVPYLSEGQALNVNFPSMNSQSSTCFTSGHAGPTFRQISGSETASVLGKVYAVPRFTVKNGSVVLKSKRMYKVSEAISQPERISSLEYSRLQHLLADSEGAEFSVQSSKYGSTEAQSEPKYSDNDDLNELLCNAREYKALESCEIAVSVNDLAHGSSLDADVFDVMKYLR